MPSKLAAAIRLCAMVTSSARRRQACHNCHGRCRVGRRHLRWLDRFHPLHRNQHRHGHQYGLRRYNRLATSGGSTSTLSRGCSRSRCRIGTMDIVSCVAFRQQFRASESNSSDQGGCRFNLNPDLLLGTHVIYQAGGKL
jgi:hypothetical protein